MDSFRLGHFFISGFFHEKPFPELPALTHCGDALCARGHRLAPHSHPGFEFLYLARGGIRWRGPEGTVAQRMGDIFVARPGERHATAVPSTEETHQLWIGLDLEKLGPEGARAARLLRKGNVRLLRDCAAAEPILQAIVRHVVTPLPRRRMAINAYVRVLLVLMEQALLLSGRPAGARLLPYSYGVQKALAYLEKHPDRRVPLSELATVAGIRQPSHFCARFRREVGVTPAARHLRHRLSDAKAALLRPHASVTEIALLHGFSSSQHFSGAFRRHFGTPPRAWREKGGITPR